MTTQTSSFVSTLLLPLFFILFLGNFGENANESGKYSRSTKSKQMICFRYCHHTCHFLISQYALLLFQKNFITAKPATGIFLRMPGNLNYEKHALRVSRVIAVPAKSACKHAIFLATRVNKKEDFSASFTEKSPFPSSFRYRKITLFL